jgi:hypothetical protein
MARRNFRSRRHESSAGARDRNSCPYAHPLSPVFSPSLYPWLYAFSLLLKNVLSVAKSKRLCRQKDRNGGKAEYISVARTNACLAIKTAGQGPAPKIVSVKVKAVARLRDGPSLFPNYPIDQFF